ARPSCTGRPASSATTAAGTTGPPTSSETGRLRPSRGRFPRGGPARGRASPGEQLAENAGGKRRISEVILRRAVLLRDLGGGEQGVEHLVHAGDRAVASLAVLAAARHLAAAHREVFPVLEEAVGRSRQDPGDVAERVRAG